jgi:hypothetical protein
MPHSGIAMLGAKSPRLVRGITPKQRAAIHDLDCRAVSRLAHLAAEGHDVEGSGGPLISNQKPRCDVQ